MTIKKIQRNSGFTIPEMMLTFSLIIIIMGITFGDVTSVLISNRDKEEEVIMKEIKKAMHAFLDDVGQLPEEIVDTLGLWPANNSWADDLVPYTDLSADQMLLDVRFIPRQYRMFSQPEVFRDATFETYYGVVYSYGDDLTVDAGATLGALTPGVGTPSPNLNPFPNAGGDMAIYTAIETGNLGDDRFFKITDRKTKMENYEVTANRLSAIVGALQSYSISQMNFAISLPEADWDIKLYYPPSQITVAPLDTATYGTNGINGVVEDTDTFLGAANSKIDVAGGTALADGDRRDDMVALMRMLGLPDSYCCSAMSLGVDNLPAPFYYYSNPRRKVGAGCTLGRGSNPQNDLMMPPRLTIDPDICG